MLQASEKRARAGWPRPRALSSQPLFERDNPTCQLPVGKERLRPILPAISRAVYDVSGDPGSANAVKLAGNFLIASAMQAMAEAFTFGEKQGLDRSQLSKLFAETRSTARSIATTVGRSPIRCIGRLAFDSLSD